MLTLIVQTRYYMTTDMDTELIDSSNILAFYSHSWLHLQLVIAGYSWLKLVTAGYNWLQL